MLASFILQASSQVSVSHNFLKLGSLFILQQHVLVKIPGTTIEILTWIQPATPVLRRVTKGNCKPTAWCQVCKGYAFLIMVLILRTPLTNWIHFSAFLPNIGTWNCKTPTLSSTEKTYRNAPGYKINHPRTHEAHIKVKVNSPEIPWLTPAKTKPTQLQSTPPSGAGF